MLGRMSCSIAVITVSDRSFSGEREDGSGPLAVHLLSEFGPVSGPHVIPDGEDSVRGAIEEAVRAGAEVVFTTGGTGITTRDLTPEGTLPLVERRLWGVENLMRNNPGVPTAALSRGVAGIVRVNGTRAFVLNAPGSTGGVRDVVAVVGPLFAHIVEQMNDGESLHTAPVPSHEEATWAIQHRGEESHADAFVARAGITGDPISMEQLIADVDSASAGAIVTFCGQVRNHDDARGVTSIDYEAHPDANAVVAAIAREVARASGATRLAVVHRVGHLEVGDVALGAAVSASHRAEAFAVLESLIEKVKLSLPVWKKQDFVDGSHEWTGCA